MKIKAALFFSVLIGSLSAGLTAVAAEKVLRLPFVSSAEMGLAQGWIYTWNKDHKAADYYYENQQGDWVSFEVRAAYHGELECYAPGSPKYSASLGTTCAVFHNVNGIDFVSLYSHLTSFVPPADTRVSIGAGDILGMAGNTGTGAGDYIHLHFELHLGKSICYGCRMDPYDLYVKVGSYPQPFNGQSGLLGVNHWWAMDPPNGFAEGSPGETCNDGIQNQGEADVDCGGPCPPCNPSQCTDGDRRRCWVECTQQAQQYPAECIFADGPLLMGIETCQAGQWGLCETADGTTCADISSECQNGNVFPTSYECVDGGLRDGGYTCFEALGAQCMTSFYSGWPPEDCQDLCVSGDDACFVDNYSRSCEIYCDAPGGQVIQGTQTCQDYSCGTLVWGPCNPNLVNNVSPCL